MKKAFATSFFILALLTLGCSSEMEQKSSDLVADSQLSLKVDGMVCVVGCAKYIEKQVAKMDGVTSCEVNFEEGTASIEFSGEVTNREEIVNSITNINEGQYQVEVVELSNIDNELTSPESGKSAKEKSPKVSFHFPELITYFISRIVR